MKALTLLFLLFTQLVKAQITIINQNDLFAPTMLDSMPDGTYTFVFEKLNFDFLIGQYKLNKPDGVWQYFSRDSVIQDMLVYDNGIPIIYKQYYNGEIYVEKVFKQVEIKDKIKYWCPTIPDYVLVKPIILSPDNSEYVLTTNSFEPKVKLTIFYSNGKIESIENGE